MSGRLDQSLDSIIDSKKKAQRDARRRKAPKAGKVAAPVGGIKKSTRPVKSAVKTVAGPTPRGAQKSKIVVSGLPYDVNESQIKEYFQKSVGSVKKVDLHYNQTGQSRGVVDILFSNPDAAAKAAKNLNGMLVDGRPMKIEVVVDASNVPEPAPAKSLSERVAANPKAQPKSATATKTNDAKKGKQAKPKKARSARPKAKTAEELDQEMTDYWGNNNAANGAAAEVAAVTTVPAVAPAIGDDMGMEEIS